MALSDQITKALSALIGLPLWDSCRVADMEMFDLGRRCARLNRKGEQIAVGEYSLHIQCPWRIVGPHGIVVGSYDRIYPADDNEDWLEFDSGNPSRCEAKLAALFDQHANAPLIVESGEGDSVGGFRLLLLGGFVLEAFPVTSGRRESSEHWRLLLPSEHERHFVVTGDGVETIGP